MSEDTPTYGERLAGLLMGRRRSAGVREATQWHEQILGGLPVGAVDNLKSVASMTDAEVARLLGVGEATLRRARAAGGVLDSTTSDRLFRLSKIIATAIEVLESESNAVRWLRRPQPALGERIPLDLLATQAGADEVETLLRRIDYGVYT